MKAITEMFPSMENAKENIEELRSMGVENSDIRQLLTGKEITYTGNLYDREKKKILSGQERKDRHSQKSEWNYHHLDE